MLLIFGFPFLNIYIYIYIGVSKLPTPIHPILLLLGLFFVTILFNSPHEGLRVAGYRVLGLGFRVKVFGV